LLAALICLKEWSHRKNLEMNNLRQSSIFCFSASVMLLLTRGPAKRTIKVISSIFLLLSKKRMCGRASGFLFKMSGSRKLMGESASRLGCSRSALVYT